ncbi:condensin complex subunit 3 [Sabethes cyaneus]|uniref:condensin complex subunit 3 n=1 Tax=Sabethes cyaneus TaxID=53552 RepID=UPI00237DE826|nr:condensin complex subunit 3 [Sabethes cyaneus]
MAPRKRRIKVTVPTASPEKAKYSIVVIQTILNGQESETSHVKVLKELKNIYPTVTHESFMKSFIQSLKGAMQHEEANEYANNRLKLCAKFIAHPDYSEQEETHPIIVHSFDWLLGTISPSSTVRFRICQFVNLVLNAMGPEASLDDDICDKILRYMLERMRDVSPNVRVQAVLALQRLQNPDNPDDCVFRTYIYHLDTDPSPKVRQSIITSLGRNYRTLPYILERLWDVEERVRRHTYLQMSSYPVKQYKVAQRLTFLEQGLKDHSESVRKVVKNVLIPQWFESYQKNYVLFVKALKIDAEEMELERFRNTANLALFEIFSKYGIADATSMLGVNEEDKTVPLESLTIETAICWQALLDFLQKTESDELENLMVDLSTFCNYIKVFADNPSVCNYIRMLADDPSMIAEKLQKMYFQTMLQILLEIIDSYDFGDEFGRETLKKILADVLCNCDLAEENVKIILSIFERLIVDVETRFKFFVDLINGVLEPSRADVSNSSRSMVEEYLEKNPDKGLQMKISKLRLNIMELKEQEMVKANAKDYAGAQRVSDELNKANEEYASLLKPILLEVSSSTDGTTIFRESMLKPKKITNATINKCLQISFYLVNSNTVRSLTPIVCDLYKTFISRYLESAEIATRDWALRSAVAFSMLYDGLSKDTFQLLYQQFFRNHCTRIWQTSIEGIFELMDRYGIEHFDVESKKDESRKNTRQLYNTMDYLDQDEDAANTSNMGTGVTLMRMMTHFLETCEDNVICTAIVDGFCRLILRGHCTSQEIMSKLLLKYFNPTTEPKTQQILGIFFEALINRKRQEVLQKALLSTVCTIMEAPNDSPLHEVKPEHVLKFVVDSTKPVFCSPGLNLHNMIAMSSLQVMLDNLHYKDLLKILSKELLSLEISDDPVLKNDLINCLDKVLEEETMDPKIVKHLKDFKQLLEGTYREPLLFSSSRAPPTNETREADEHSDHEEALETIEEDENHPPAPNREVPIINKSSLQTDDTNRTLSSPAKSFTSSPVPPSTPPATPTTFGAQNTTGMKSLRKSMNFLGFPEQQVVPKNIFKVPDANTAKALRQVQQKANKKRNQTPAQEEDSDEEKEDEPVAVASNADQESFAIPATQDTSTSSSADGDTSILHLEIPETQPSPTKEVVTSSQRDSVKVKTPSKRKMSTDSSEEATSTSSEESTEVQEKGKKGNKTLEEDVVNASPNATVSRLDRSIIRPLVKASAKSIVQSKGTTPQTLPRTRTATRVDTMQKKATTRKSLGVPDKNSSKRSSLTGITALPESPKKTRTRTSTVAATATTSDSNKEAKHTQNKEKEVVDSEVTAKRPSRRSVGVTKKGSPTKETNKQKDDDKKSESEPKPKEVSEARRSSRNSLASSAKSTRAKSAEKPPAKTSTEKQSDQEISTRRSLQGTRAARKTLEKTSSSPGSGGTGEAQSSPKKQSSSSSDSASQTSSGGGSSSFKSAQSHRTPVATRASKGRASASAASSSSSKEPSESTSASSLSSSEISSTSSPLRGKRIASTPLSAIRTVTRSATTTAPTRPVRKVAKKQK